MSKEVRRTIELSIDPVKDFDVSVVDYKNLDFDMEFVFDKFIKGDKGDPPVKGVDYWTASDKLEIINDILQDPDFQSELNNKQDALVSGTNIKTINNESILGSGNIVIQGGGGGTGDYEELDNLPSINNVELIGNKTTSDLGLQTELTIDATPTENSTNPVQSGGVFTALANLIADGCLYGGIVNPYSEPSDDKRFFYISETEGVYTHFDNLELNGKNLFIIHWDNYFETWAIDSFGESHEGVEQDIAQRFNLLYLDLGFDRFSPLISYSPYDYVTNIEIGGLWRFNTNHQGVWDENDVDSVTLVDFIDDLLNGKQDTISDLATIRSGAAAGATAIQSSEKGTASGVATLDSGGKVPQSQLPSYVDDVLEYANIASFPVTGESGKIYVALDTNKTYRWSGSTYVEIAQGLALGETASTAFPGNRGKAIEDKIPSSASSSNKLATASDVNGKLSAPSTAGTSGQVLTSDGQGGQSWQTPTSGGITDVTVGGTSVVSGGVAAVPAIPTVPIISTDIESDATSDTKTTSPKAVKTFVENQGYGTYSKPSGGIPASDLSTAVQTSLGKADTAVQQVTVGTTTTGNSGTNASVTNSGTAINPVLDFIIPRGADAVNPFKGWYASANALPANPAVGDYAYVKGATSTDPVAIYECTTDGSWSDSGRTADTSNVQTFASGEEVNNVHIVDDPTTGGVDDVLSAEQGKVLDVNSNVFETINQYYIYENEYYINSSTLKWTSSSNYCCKLIPVLPNEIIHIKSQTGYSATYCVLREGKITNNTLVSFATGYDKTVIKSGEYDVVIPEDGVALYILTKVNGSERNHTISRKKLIKDIVIDNQKTIDTLGYASRVLDLSGYTRTGNYINQQTNKWLYDANTQSIKVRVFPGDYLRIICKSDIGTNIAFLKEGDTQVAGSDVVYAGNEFQRINLARSSVNDFVVPSDAYYLFILTKASASAVDYYLPQVCILKPITQRIADIASQYPYLYPVECLEEYEHMYFNLDGSLSEYSSTSTNYNFPLLRKYAVEQGKEYYAEARLGTSATKPCIAYYDSNDVFIEFDSHSYPTGKVELYSRFKLNIPSNAAYVIIQGSRVNTNSPWTPWLHVGTMSKKADVVPMVIEYHESKIRRDVLISNNGSDPTGGSTIVPNYVQSPWAVMFPTSYTPFGEPTQVIAMLHGSDGVVNRNKMGYTTDNWIKWRAKYLEQGFAVVDINGVGITSGNTADDNSKHYGCPAAIETLDKAFEYLKQHYNVKPKMLIHGTSMGGALAQSYAKVHPNNVIAVAIFAPAMVMRSAMFNQPDRIATLFNYESAQDMRDDNFENLVGSVPFAKCLTWKNGEISETDWGNFAEEYVTNPSGGNTAMYSYDMLEKFPVPIRCWHGLSDSTVPYQYSQQVIDSYRRAGSDATLRLVQGAEHNMSAGAIDYVIDEAIDYFNMFI